jgi:nucleotide-binding universal stress UspA family protein
MEVLQSINQVAFKNILFLTDFTEASATALAYATGLARHYNAQFYPAHSCDPVILTEAANTSIIDEIENNSRAALDKLATTTGLPCTPLFARGQVTEAVPSWVEEYNIDLIVMGTHARRGLKHFLMGSVAETIFRNVTCPVLTVGPRVATRPYHDFKVESVLFPTDLAPHAEFGAHCALSLAQENNADVTFMHVIPFQEASQRNCNNPAQATYRKLVEMVPPDVKEKCTTNFLVEAGDPVVEILGFAENKRPDLIVLSLPWGKKFNGHFRTGVTYNIIASAPCPVLTVRDEMNRD